MKKGLVLEGGALRGLFTSGILDVFMEEGIEFDGAVGVSAGAAFGVNYKSRQPGRVIRYNRRFCKDYRYRSIRSLILTGDLFGADFCYREIPDELDLFDKKTFRENRMQFYCVATDVVTGKPVYTLLTDGGTRDMLWTRASSSMPLASRIVKIDDGKYLDGGISDSIPLKFMEEKGFDRNVVITTQPYDFVKGSYDNIMPVVKVSLLKYPEAVKAIRDRHIMYNKQTRYIKQREAEGEVYVIRPPEPLNIGSLEKDPDQMTRVYETGREEGRKHLSKIKRYLDGEDVR